MAAPTDRVHSISALPRSAAEDRRQRTRAYLIAMSIRTVCFVLSGVIFIVWHWMPAVWICMLAAVLLPYPAVVLANRQDRRTAAMPSQTVTHRMLTAAPEEPPRERVRRHEDPLTGEIVEDGPSHAGRL